MGGPPRSAWHSLGANGPLGGGGRDGGGDARTWDPLPRYARMYNPAIGHKARGLSVHGPTRARCGSMDPRSATPFYVNSELC